MALEVADGTINVGPDSPGTTYTVSGLSFQPKAIFFFWSGRTSTGQGEGDHKFGCGFAVSTSSRRAYTSQSDHGAANAASDNACYNDCCVATLSVTGADAFKLDLDAINSDGFRLILDNAGSIGLLVGWIAYGGSDITDVAIVDFTEPGSTGNQDITSVGFALDTGIDDKAVIFLGGSDGSFNSSATWSNWMLGVAAGNTIAQAVVSGTSEDTPTTMNTMSYCRAGECIANIGANVVNSRASLTAWLSNGFRLNWAEVDAGSVFNHSALVMKGGRWQVGDALTSTGTSNQTEGTTYVPKALLLASHCKAQSSSDTTQSDDERSVGVVTSASSRRCAGIIDKDNLATADIGIAFNETAMYVNQSTAATVVVEGLGDLVSFDSTPGFTYVMDDADPGAAFFFYLLCANAPSGLSATVGQVTETNTSQSISRLKGKALGQVTETDAAQTVARVKAKSVGQVTEVDLAQAVAHSKLKAVGQVTETDTAQAIAKSKLKTVGQTTETDLAQGFTAAKRRALDLVTETDLAQAIAHSKLKAVGQVTETDTSQAIATSKLKTIGQATETDLAQAIVGTKARTVAQVEETDLAQSLTSAKRKAVGQASETDASQSITAKKSKSLGQVTETDAAQAVLHSKLKTIGQATEIDEAQQLTPLGAVLVSQASESNVAQAITAKKLKSVGLVTESDISQAFTVAKRKAIGQVTELDIAQAISALQSGGGQIVILNRVLESDVAQAFTALKRLLVGQVVETDLAQAIGGGLPVRTAVYGVVPARRFDVVIEDRGFERTVEGRRFSRLVNSH